MATPARRRLAWACCGLALVLFAAAGWAAWAPLPSLPRERVVVIPRGTGAATIATFPSKINLTLGLQDVLVLQNDDDRPQLVAGIEVPARTKLSIPFPRATDFELNCSVHPSGKLTISVREPPAPGWARFRWRLARALG
jgi:hypothetical protein